MRHSLSQTQEPYSGVFPVAQSLFHSSQVTTGVEAIMTWKRQRVLVTASVFLVLGLMEQVTAETGQASYYTAPYTPSACFGDDESQFPANLFFAAGGDSASANIWNNGANCGKFFSIQCVGNGCNGSGPISVKIVDRCPNGCVGGRAFDLSETAFAAIADLNVGVITVEYSLIS